YWASYRYNNVSNRTAEIRHNPAGDTTRAYTYPAAGQPQPHTLTTVTTTGAATGTDSYGYDPAGNTTTRTRTGKPGQTLTYDAEGHLATVADTAGTTSHTYDPARTRLVPRDASGTTSYRPRTK